MKIGLQIVHADDTTEGSGAICASTLSRHLFICKGIHSEWEEPAPPIELGESHIEAKWFGFGRSANNINTGFRYSLVGK